MLHEGVANGHRLTVHLNLDEIDCHIPEVKPQSMNRCFVSSWLELQKTRDIRNMKPGCQKTSIFETIINCHPLENWKFYDPALEPNKVFPKNHQKVGTCGKRTLLEASMDWPSPTDSIRELNARLGCLQNKFEDVHQKRQSGRREIPTTIFDERGNLDKLTPSQFKNSPSTKLVN